MKFADGADAGMSITRRQIASQAVAASLLLLNPDLAMAADLSSAGDSTKRTELPAGGVAQSARADTVDAEEAQAEKDLSERTLKKTWFNHFVDRLYCWRLRYYFVAQNAANCDLFFGLVQDDPFIGRAAVDFIFPNGCQCKGYALVTHYPWPRSVVGQRGFIKAKCSDGRTIKGHFTTTSLTTGDGTGSDNLDNNYQFTFGHTAEQAVQDVNALRKKLGCQECNPRDLELRVTGKVLPSSK